MSTEHVLLLVDDDAVMLAATTRLLVRAGFGVMSATTGEEGLRLARTCQPRLVLLDVELPDYSGLEVLRQIRADPELENMSVVFLSAKRIQSEHQVSGLEVGADGYIARPISNEELLARVRAHWRLSELIGQLRASEGCFRDMITRLGDGVVVVSNEGIIQFVNPAAENLFGRPAAELTGTRFGFPLDDASLVEIELPLPQRTVRHVEMRITHTVWNTQPAWLANLRDLTETTAAKSSLRQKTEELRRRKEELAGFDLITAGQELRVIKLQQEANTLSERLELPPPYPSHEPGN